MFEANRSPRLALIAEAMPNASASLASPKNESAILGFLIALHITPEWELENIVVTPAARRKGVGRHLLNALLTAAQGKNSKSVFLEVRESNLAARALYEKVRFTIVGRRPCYYADPQEDAMLYRYVLVPSRS